MMASDSRPTMIDDETMPDIAWPGYDASDAGSEFDFVNSSDLESIATDDAPPIEEEIPSLTPSLVDLNSELLLINSVQAIQRGYRAHAERVRVRQARQARAKTALNVSGVTLAVAGALLAVYYNVDFFAPTGPNYADLALGLPAPSVSMALVARTWSTALVGPPPPPTPPPQDITWSVVLAGLCAIGMYLLLAATDYSAEEQAARYAAAAAEQLVEEEAPRVQNNANAAGASRSRTTTKAAVRRGSPTSVLSMNLSIDGSPVTPDAGKVVLRKYVEVHRLGEWKRFERTAKGTFRTKADIYADIEAAVRAQPRRASTTTAVAPPLAPASSKLDWNSVRAATKGQGFSIEHMSLMYSAVKAARDAGRPLEWNAFQAFVKQQRKTDGAQKAAPKMFEAYKRLVASDNGRVAAAC